jgi:hypothetical protein
MGVKKLSALIRGLYNLAGAKFDSATPIDEDFDGEALPARTTLLIDGYGFTYSILVEMNEMYQGSYDRYEDFVQLHLEWILRHGIGIIVIFDGSYQSGLKDNTKYERVIAREDSWNLVLYNLPNAFHFFKILFN